MKFFRSASFRSCALLLTLALAATFALADAPNPDALAHYKKARELLQSERYADAQKEADQAVSLDPTFQDAKLLQTIITARLAAHPATPTTTGPATGPAEAPGRADVLSPEQISRIRVIELGPKENGLTGTIDRKALEDFWANVILKGPNGAGLNDAQRNAFLNPNNFTTQVYQIRAAGDASYLAKIKLTKDPANFVIFKSLVQTYISQNCANCHSGPKSHGFRLFGTPNRPATEAEIYTNFYNLAQYAKGDALMIDRDNPDRSLLLQYALPKKIATYPHPGKAEVANKFANDQDPRFKEIVKWITTLTFPRPNYGVDFNLAALNAPAPEPSTAPATEPTK